MSFEQMKSGDADSERSVVPLQFKIWETQYLRGKKVSVTFKPNS